MADRQPISALKIVVDPTLPEDELRLHPAMFDLLRQAFIEADMLRGFSRPSDDIFIAGYIAGKHDAMACCFKEKVPHESKDANVHNSAVNLCIWTIHEMNAARVLSKRE